MLHRLDAGIAPRRRELPPVAWHGRFATSSLAETEPEHVPAAAPIAAVYAFESTVIETGDPTDSRPFDPHTDAVATITETDPTVLPEMPPPPEPEPEPEPALLTPPPPVAPYAPWPQPMQETLDADVRALIDELYEHARAEMSGEDIAFFAPAGGARSGESCVNEPLVNEVVGEAPAAAPSPAPTPGAGTEGATEPPPNAPAAPNASSVKRTGRARSGWVAAIQTGNRQQSPRG
ncbi:MAG TPA: hypothetical protein VEZ15_06700 [Acidimicrobiia bacterium]|nr:hypothetical protein [Acidimicrobiia bacterium]